MLNKFRKLTSKPPVCVGTGLVALDVVYEKPDKHSYLATGGSCGNVLTILSEYGWDAYPAAIIGCDLAAEYILSDLGQFAVKNELIQLDSQLSTPVILEFIENINGETRHKFSRTCHVTQQKLPRHTPVSDDLIDQIIENIDKFDVYYLDRLTLETLELAKLFRAKNKIVYFEPQTIENLTLFEQMLKVANIVKLSSEYFEEDLLRLNGPELLIQTQGKAGLSFSVKIKNNYIHKDLKSISVNKLVDACGSGDWLSANIINKLCSNGPEYLSSMSFENVLVALNHGQEASAHNLKELGARGGMYRHSMKYLNSFNKNSVSFSKKKLKISNNNFRPIDLLEATKSFSN